MDKMNQAAENLANGILNTIRQAINSEVKSDISFKAKVIGLVDGNIYNILYKNTKYTATSNLPLLKDQIVNVIAPRNNWSELIVIPYSSSKIFDKNIDVPDTDIATYIQYTTHKINNVDEAVPNASNNRSMYFVCEPNSTYVISMNHDGKSSVRFRAGTTTSELTSSSIINNLVFAEQDLNGINTYQGKIEINVKTKSSDKYIVLFYWTASPYLNTWENIRNTIKITKFK